MAMDMNKMMKQAQKMQLELARAQEEIKELTCTAASGGGAVEATAKGDGTLTALTIKAEVVDPDDTEMLEDLVLAACNEALRAVAVESEQRLGAATGGMSIPGLL